MKPIGILFVAVPWLLFTCQSGPRHDNDLLFGKENLVAWCIVPFDSTNRTPEARATMLNDLGLTQFAYDWRAKHIASFPDEIKTLQKHGIKLRSVWLWIESDSVDIINGDNEKLLTAIRQESVKTDFWVGFSNGYFEGLTEDERMRKAVKAVQLLDERANELGCTISLYNHGDWFGEPANQIDIIKGSGQTDIGMIYNFHHAHHQVKDFPTLLPKMLPYLKTVNINGMKIEGPKILPVGQGDQELAMLKLLKDSGYNGPIGILGHVEAADARVILEGNLTGLQSLLKEMNDQAALATY